MGHPFFETTRALVIAHRGGAGLAPENTLKAFDRGLQHGADGLELDVRLSRDGVAVVHHDRRLERTTNLQGELSGFTAEDLARADAGYGFVQAGGWPFRGCGIGVPTLTDVLDRYRDARVIIEMKENRTELAFAVVEAVRRSGALDRVCLGSFGLRVLRAARTMEPRVATSASREEVRWALYRSWCRWPIARAAYGGYQVPETSGATRIVSPRFVDDAHRSGLRVQVWTVDREDDARRLLSWGVDALITDRPDVIVPVVGSQGSQGSRGSLGSS